MLCLFLCLPLCTGCSSKAGTSSSKDTSSSSASASSGKNGASAGDGSAGSGENSSSVRDNTPVVRTPSADGTVTFGNEAVTIDASHTDDGYAMVNYTGDISPVKLQITIPDGTVYTYDLHGGYETFSLTGGNGQYLLVVYENVVGDQYSTCYSTQLDVSLANEFGPYLYPNQYVNFSAASHAVSLGAQLAENAETDLDVVKNIYTYTTENITYDTKKASDVQSGYLPDVDSVLSSGTGICFDYAAVMAAMLRSQDIPTRLEVGYAGTVYHAWVSVHIDELGWINGIIEFDGQEWKLMDPTFAANSATSAVKQFIGNGSNYQTKYVY